MKLWRVDDVMTRDVATVRPETPFRDVVEVLISRRVSAAPVVDRFGYVVGVVSEADLLPKLRAGGQRDVRTVPGWRRRAERVKAAGRTAGDVMSQPAVTVLPSLAVAAAAHRLVAEHVRRMPVVDDLGRLVGIVSRGDLLKMQRRPDADIRREVVDDLLHRVLATQDGWLRVETHDGVVTLRGRLARRSACDRAVRLARPVTGVVDVVNLLDHDVDDTKLTRTLFGAG